MVSIYQSKETDRQNESRNKIQQYITCWNNLVQKQMCRLKVTGWKSLLPVKRIWKNQEQLFYLHAKWISSQE